MSSAPHLTSSISRYYFQGSGAAQKGGYPATVSLSPVHRTPRPSLILLRASPASEFSAPMSPFAQRPARRLGWVWPDLGAHSVPLPGPVTLVWDCWAPSPSSPGRRAQQRAMKEQMNDVWEHQLPELPFSVSRVRTLSPALLPTPMAQF